MKVYSQESDRDKQIFSQTILPIITHEGDGGAKETFSIKIIKE